jgi:hypothetical protein
MVAPDGFAPETPVTAQWKRLSGVIVDQAPGQPVARLPMERYLAVLVNGRPRGPQGVVSALHSAAGVRRQEFVFTAADGRFDFDLLPTEIGSGADRTFAELRSVYIQAYQVDPDGKVVRAVDMLKGGRGVRLTGDLQAREDRPLRAIVFTAGELGAMEFFDPRFLQDLRLGAILEAPAGNRPRRLNFSLDRGILAAHVEHRLRWELLLRSGITRNSMSLLNVADPRLYRPRLPRDLILGFSMDEPLPDHPMVVAARDFYRLDERRLQDYARAGVRSKPIELLHAQTGRLLEEVEETGRTETEGAFGGGPFLAAATGALANEIRAYQAIRSMADDVVRGAVLLLLALVPFAFAMERLLVATPRVYRQLVAVGVIFLAMAAVLWAFHPAFRLSPQPLMIVMAFAILLMGLLVLSVVYARFEAGLEEARTGRAESSGARTSRLGVLGTAVRLGIANMRRRKFRTALTGLAVVLTTFALLCFVSASSYVGQRRRDLSQAAPYRGVLVREPGRRPMPEKAAAYLETVVGPGRLVRRYWWVSPSETEWRIHVRSARTGRQVSVQAALGLEGGEGGLTAVGRVCPDWHRFAALAEMPPAAPEAGPDGVRGGCYLARAVAEELGAAPGDELLVAGRTVELVGAFDPARFDRDVVDLDGQPLRPIDFSALGSDQRTFFSSEDVDVLAPEAETLEPEAGLPSVPSSGLLVLPASLVRGLRDARLRGLAVPEDGPGRAEGLALDLARRLAMPVYFGSGGGAAVVVSTPLLPEAPRGLAVPLAIAGLIILNTMLSSIADRKREIYIYTSIGLAPLHVGALFLAEAAVYGLMGSIFGYVVGQGLATAFSALGWLGSLTLNYSGTQAVAVMGMVLMIVVVSSLVPAFLAGRLAVPSHRMSWAVPRPDGDRIRDTLPFTVTGRTSGGVLVFLLEYFDAHREGSIGHFATDAFEAIGAGGPLGPAADAAGGAPRPPGPSAPGPALVGLEGTVWLAPYDLGVRQRVRLGIRPASGPAAGSPGQAAAPEETIYEIDIDLVREAGQVRSWWNLNRVFLGDLRRQLLGWRNLRLDRILDYIRRAAEGAGGPQGPSPGPEGPGFEGAGPPAIEGTSGA